MADVATYLNQMRRMGDAYGKSDGILEAGKIIDKFFHENSSKTLFDIYVELQRALNDASHVHFMEYCSIISENNGQTTATPAGAITPEGATA